MLFNSYLFLFAFLPTTLVVFLLLGRDLEAGCIHHHPSREGSVAVGQGQVYSRYIAFWPLYCKVNLRSKLVNHLPIEW